MSIPASVQLNFQEVPNREVYNAFVQRVQLECNSFNLEHRIRPSYYKEKLIEARLEVFWDGWRSVAYEKNPLTPSVEYSCNEDYWNAIVYDVVGALK